MKRRQFVTACRGRRPGRRGPGRRRSRAGAATTGRSTGPVLGCQRGPTDLRAPSALQASRRRSHLRVSGQRGGPGELDGRLADARCAIAAQRRASRSTWCEFPMLSSASIDTHDAPARDESAARGRTRQGHHAREGPRAAARDRVRADDHPQLRARRHPGRQIQHEPDWRAADRRHARPRRLALQHLAACRGERRAAAHRGRRGLRRDGLGAHHLLPRARRPGGHRAQGPSRLPPARSRRAAARLPRRRPRARHGRRDEALRRHRREPLPRPEPLPRDDRRDAAGSRTARSTT